MNSSGDQLLASSGLAGNEHGSIGGGDAADVVERFPEPGALANDLPEVMCRFDLFLEVKVLLLETGPFSLSQHAGGDVDPDGTTGDDLAALSAYGLHP